MTPTGGRLRPLLRPLLSSLFYQPQLQLLISRRFSSFSDRSCRNPPSFVDDPDTSIVYRHTLRTQRPSTIEWQKELQNSDSFIGTVISPLKTFATSGGTLGVHTQLQVDPPSGSKRFLRILLNMWDDMAELSIQHLKPNDYIYVSGYLGSFTKALDNGNNILSHKLLVKEINFIANINQKSNNAEDREESDAERRRKRLYLWQVFFANPYEWQDLRTRKVSPSQPDFMHKGSGEALWLRSFDPPWVFRQLQRHDSRIGDMGLHSSRTSSFEL